jgi:hypothetical protein
MMYLVLLEYASPVTNFYVETFEVVFHFGLEDIPSVSVELCFTSFPSASAAELAGFVVEN